MESQTLRIRLLGEIDIRRGEARLPALESARAESLLAYLLIHRDAPQPRQRLAFLLWPDSTEAQARTNLRHVLHNLRRALPDADRFLDVTPRTLQWRPEAPFELDLADFEDALAAGGVDALRRAVDAYRGDLVEGCYDEWLLAERERLRELHRHALERLAAALEQRGELGAAIRYAERLQRDDPLREATCRLLMRLHDARGDRARALRVYHACAGALERELDVEPAPATRASYDALLPSAAEPETGGPAAFVGRAAERARLTEVWRACERGRAQLLLVTGEAGIGKTRLVEELRAWCAHRGAATAEARSYPAEGALAYAPVTTWLRSAQIAPRRVRLDRAALSELARLLPEVTAQPAPAAGDQRGRLFDALARTLLATAGPLLLVADDAHWADAETLQFLHYLIRTARDAPLLVLATARREEMDERHPLAELVRALRALDRVTEVELGRLSRQETAVLAGRLSGRPLEQPETERLFAETEGNPLFVVEALRADWAGEGVSPRVQAVLEARLAQLSDRAQDLAGVAAVIGREFTSDLLAAASDAGEEALVRGLDELWRRRIVREQGPDAYDFSHDKLREAAYGQLTPARRRRNHLDVARGLERLHGADSGPVSGQIAAHYDRAGATHAAVPWYQRAAGEAQRMYANVEAMRLIDRALELVAALPRGLDRDRRELALLTAAVVPLAVLEGTASERLTEVQRRALRLSEGAPPAPPLLRSVAITSLSQGRFDDARTVARQLRAAPDPDGVLTVEGEYVLGVCAFWQGELKPAREHFEAAVAGSRPEQRATHLVRYGLDPHVVCLSRLANTLWFLGDGEAALRARDDALALADPIEHPPTTATALVFAALLALDSGDTDGMRGYTAAVVAQSLEQHARGPAVAVESFGGYLDVVDGRAEVGLARIRRALAETSQAERAPGVHASVERVLVEACALAGDPVAGLAAADAALVGGVRLWEAEIRRRRAEFLAAQGRSPDAELQRALRVAQWQGAAALELKVRGTLAERSAAHRAPV